MKPGCGRKGGIENGEDRLHPVLRCVQKHYLMGGAIRPYGNDDIPPATNGRIGIPSVEASEAIRNNGVPEVLEFRGTDGERGISKGRAVDGIFVADEPDVPSAIDSDTLLLFATDRCHRLWR